MCGYSYVWLNKGTDIYRGGVLGSDLLCDLWCFVGRDR